MKALPQLKRDKVSFAKDDDPAEEAKAEKIVPKDLSRTQKIKKFVNTVTKPKSLAKQMAELPDYPAESVALFPENRVMTIEEAEDDPDILIYGSLARESVVNWRWGAEDFVMPVAPPGDAAVLRPAMDELADIIEVNEARYSEEM